MAQATYPRVKRSGPLLPSYLVLLRVGFALPDGLLRPRCALTAPFHPYPVMGRYIFCGTFRKARFDRTLPAVSRHAALWRPDFPPRKRGDCPSGKLRFIIALKARTGSQKESEPQRRGGAEKTKKGLPDFLAARASPVCCAVPI